MGPYKERWPWWLIAKGPARLGVRASGTRGSRLPNPTFPRSRPGRSPAPAVWEVLAVPLDLRQNRGPIDETDPTFHDVLEDLQGNILNGHGRFHAVHIFI